VLKDGRATLGADPLENLDAATKQYVDNLFNELKAIIVDLQTQLANK
jgi:hypothetical protein